jgi:hypothetical protein
VVSPRYHYGLEDPDCLARMPEEAPFPTPEVGKETHFFLARCIGSAILLVCGSGYAFGMRAPGEPI